MEGAKASFGGEVFCGYCAEELDENGLFPEEREGAWEIYKTMLCVIERYSKQNSIQDDK